MPSIPEDELQQLIDILDGPPGFHADLWKLIRQYAAKERLDEARHWDEHIIGAPRKVTVNDAARERIKQLKEGM